MSRAHAPLPSSERSPNARRPAHVTTTWRPPNSLTARAASACMSAERPTSPRWATARPPAPRASSATRSTESARSPSTSAAPSAANASAIARPMPPPAPVMTTASSRKSTAASGDADADRAEAREGRAHRVAGLGAEEERDRARHDEVARPEPEAARAQAVGDPRDRVERVAHHLGRGVGGGDRAVQLVDEALDGEHEPRDTGHRRDDHEPGALAPAGG